MSGVVAIEVGVPGPPGEGMDPGQVAAIEQAVSRLPDTAGEPQKFLVWDSDESRLGYFDGPMLVSSWAPYKIEHDVNVATKIQTFLNDVALLRVPGALLPGTYRAEDVVEVPSNTHLRLHDATINCYDPDLGTGSSYRAPMLRILNTENITIEGGTLNGRKDAWAATEFKYGIGIYGGQNITIRDVTAIDCKGDGIGIEWYDSSVEPEDILVERFRSTGAHRNGGYIAAGINVTFRDCIFEGTSGTLPMAGFDVEPWTETKVLKNVTFDRCVFRNNTGTGLSFIMPQPDDAPDQHTFLLNDCQFLDNDDVGLYIASGRNITANNPIATGNAKDGIGIGVTGGRSIRINGGYAEHNTLYGVRIGTATTDVVKDVWLSGLTVRQNGQRGISSVVGTTNGVDGLTIENCTIGDLDVADTQAHGLHFYSEDTSLTKNVHLLNNSFGNATTAKVTIPSGVRPHVTARNNRGYVTEAKGTASVANGGTIAHGCAVTPTWASVEPTVAGRVAAVTAISTTHLTISLQDNAGSNVTAAENVRWRAEV